MIIDHAEHPAAVLGDTPESVAELRIACVPQGRLGVLSEYEAWLHAAHGSVAADSVRYAVGCMMAAARHPH